MFRLWGKIFQNNHLLKDMVVCKEGNDTRTHKVFAGIEKICYEFDLGKPLWLESNIKDFKKHAKVKFRQDSFIEEIEFDYLEIEIIEEDD